MARTAGTSPMRSRWASAAGQTSRALSMRRSSPDGPEDRRHDRFLASSITPPAQSGGHEQRPNAGGSLEAPQDDVDVQGINLHAPAGPARLLGGHEGRSGTEEGVSTMSSRWVRSSSAS